VGEELADSSGGEAFMRRSFSGGVTL
jgi:hypothetical protein